jgi:DNA mismatch repair protein MutS
MAPLIKEYFKLTEEYKKEYGENSIVLMQVGAFFEVYGLQDKNGIVTGSNIKYFSEYCDLATPPKHVIIENKQVIMAGFRDYQLDKYLNKLQEMGYTTAVYVQDVQAPNTTRSLSGIYSPGTYFSNNTQSASNNTLCIKIQLQKATKQVSETIHIGLSIVDVYTGKTTIFEFQNEYQHNPSTYDELERFVSIYNPNEVIIISELEENIIDDIITFSGIQCSSIHRVSRCGNNKLSTCVENSEKQNYQLEIIKRFFPEEKEYNFFEHFYQYELATQSFCFLLDYIYGHNPHLVDKLTFPVFENCSNRLILANHSLKQLNMIDDNSFSGKLSSVSKYLNNCSTIMGKRRFAYDLLNPIVDIKLLEESYQITEHLMKKDKYLNYRNTLSTVTDIEKLRRKLILTKITPKDFYMLHSNILTVKNLYIQASKDKKLLAYLNNYVDKTILEDCDALTKIIQNNLNLENCKNVDTLNFDKTKDFKGDDMVLFIQQGASKKVDEKLKNCIDSCDQLICIKDFFNKLLKPYDKKSTKDLVKIHETASLGSSLTTTQRRGALLKNEINKLASSSTIWGCTYYSNFTKQDETIQLKLEEIQYNQTGTGKNTTIVNDQIKNICNEMRTSQDKLIREIQIFFQSFINDFVKYEKKMENIIECVLRLDTLQCKCYNAKQYNYCKPTISKETKKSFIQAKGLRHCLIEKLQTSELYVSNDVTLGHDKDGILLYGTNAVGKTSFIKSLGISVIMAQAGMYVPCTSFDFFPYQYIFTRILGNDNIFKGLSTFAVEMSELRTILKLANENSLILGDELCSGTESDSAKSIFVAGIENLHKIQSSFIFATHFHEIVNYEEIKLLENLDMKHMTVIYNRETRKLVYDRKLKDGPGNSMYGLEVCKSLDLPDDFLSRAHDIRMKYDPKSENILSKKPSHFNAKKIKGMCEHCGQKMGVDVHHLQYQKNANEYDYIGSNHKNHLANLINICKSCHDNIHKQNIELRKVKTSDGYEYVQINM